jgi:hypothetical protein
MRAQGCHEMSFDDIHIYKSHGLLSQNWLLSAAGEPSDKFRTKAKPAM